MIINKLTLDNFKSHEHTVINFNKGISLILGGNGAGKSSILEAISYALFNVFNGKVDEVIRKPYDINEQVNSMSVTLEFEHNSTKYRIKRGKNKSSNVAELKYLKDDKFILKCKGVKAVTTDVEDILGIDSQSFLNAVYIRQGEITDLIEKRASERKEFIAKLLNIDALEIAWDQIKDVIKVYEDQKQVNEGKLDNKENLIENKSSLEKTITEHESEILNVSSNLKKYNLQKDDVENELKTLEAKKIEYETQDKKLFGEKEKLQNHKSTLENVENSLTEILKDEVEIKKLEKECNILPYLKKIKENKDTIDSKRKDIEKYDKEINDINTANQALENNKKHFEAYEELTRDKEQLLKNKEELDNIINSENENLNKKEALKEEKDNLFTDIQTTVEYCNNVFNDKFKNAEEIEIRHKDEKNKIESFLDTLNKKITENNETIINLKTKINSTKKSLNDLENTKDTCPICQSNISHEKHEELSSKYKHDIAGYEIKLEELNEANDSQKMKIKEEENKLKAIEKINIELLKDQYNRFIETGNKIKEINNLLVKHEEHLQKQEKIKNSLEETDIKLEENKKGKDNYLFAKRRLEELPTVDVINSKKKPISDKIIELKNESKDIMAKYGIEDDIDRKITYLENQENILNQLRGKVANKDNLTTQKENTLNEINSKTDSIKEIKEKIKQINFSSEVYENINAKYTSINENIKNIEIQQATLATKIESDKIQLSQIEGELNKLNKLDNEQHHLEDYIKLLNDIRDLYSKDGVQRDLRNKARPQIEKSTTDIFSKFDFDYTAINLDEDYNISIENRDETLELSMLSGGEKIVIALALRLGIAQVITKNKTELLILDEPTVHLDAERRSKLIDIIRQINIVPQMIVVSHDDEMESLSNNIIKIKKSNGISTSE